MRLEFVLCKFYILDFTSDKFKSISQSFWFCFESFLLSNLIAIHLVYFQKGFSFADLWRINFSAK